MAQSNLEVVTKNLPSLSDLNSGNNSVTSKGLPLYIPQSESKTIDLWTKPSQRYIPGTRSSGGRGGMSPGRAARWEPVPSKKDGTAIIEIIDNQKIDNYRLTYGRPSFEKKDSGNFMKISVNATQTIDSKTQKSLFKTDLLYRCSDENCTSAQIAAAVINYDSGPITSQFFSRNKGTNQIEEDATKRKYKTFPDQNRKFISKENFANKVNGRNYFRDDYAKDDANNPFSKDTADLYKANSQLLQNPSGSFTINPIFSLNKLQVNSAINPNTRESTPFKN
jgi:hypothetical protein